jgi:hypothetical protein
MIERERRTTRPAPEPAPAPVEPAPSPAPEDPLLTLQRSAGNQAVLAMMGATAAAASGDDDAPVRREGDWDALPFGNVDAEPEAPAARVGATDMDRAAIANPDAFLRKEGTWNAVRARYKKQELGWVKGGDDEKGHLLPTGLGMNALIAFRLRSTVVKKSDNPGARSPMEQILPDVRKRQFEELAAKQAEMGAAGVENMLPPPKPLEWNYGAGSGTATSDIDVNLSGDATEYAVERFNEVFRANWDGKESGTVFDVNVYARDYLPESGAFSLVKAGKAAAASPVDGPGAMGTGDAGWGAQGVAFETSLTEGSAAAKGASASQEVSSLLKTRKDMSAEDWQRFKDEQMEAFGDDAAGKAAKQQAFGAAEAKYLAREAAITAKVAELDAKAALLITETKKPDAKEMSPEDKRLAAENAMYEAKLKDVAAVRSKLAIAKELLTTGGRTAEQVEEVAAELQAALAEAASYANEAYITGATVLHVVGNLQLLKGSEKLSIGLSGADYLASANEQVGFIFDDLHREATVAGGLLKAGKYISRLGHAGVKAEAAAVKKAASSGGTPPPPFASPSSAQVEKYGKELMVIKDKPPSEHAAALANVNADGWKLCDLARVDAARPETNAAAVNQVKTGVLKFQSKVQTLAGKV